MAEDTFHVARRVVAEGHLITELHVLRREFAPAVLKLHSLAKIEAPGLTVSRLLPFDGEAGRRLPGLLIALEKGVEDGHDRGRVGLSSSGDEPVFGTKRWQTDVDRSLGACDRVRPGWKGKDDERNAP